MDFYQDKTRIIILLTRRPFKHQETIFKGLAGKSLNGTKDM